MAQAISPLMVVGPVLLLAGLVLVFAKRWYVQGILVVAAGMSLALFVLGIHKLTSGGPATDVSGAVLAVAGAALLLAMGVALKLLYFKRT